MSSPRQRGRRVPPKHGARSVPPQPLSGSTGAASDGTGATESTGGMGAAAPVGAIRPSGTRSQNRAAKRASDTTRVRGRVSRQKSRGYNPAIVGLAIAVVVVGAAVFLVGNPFASPAASATPVPTRLLASCPSTAPVGLKAGEKRTVTIDTELGDIVIEVDGDLAPVAAANFTLLASCGYYDGVIFHRIVPEFVIQGGDGQYGWSGGINTANVGKGGPGYTFGDEAVKGEYVRGTVAMANSGPNTNGSQFFICVADLTKSLGKNYTIFGHVTEGMDVVDTIVGAGRNSNDYPNRPIAMRDLTVVNGAAPTPSPGAPTTAPTAAPSTPPATGSPAATQ